jgi:hypothetical protein
VLSNTLSLLSLCFHGCFEVAFREVELLRSRSILLDENYHPKLLHPSVYWPLPDHAERNCSPKEAMAAWCDLVRELLSGRQPVGRGDVAVDARVQSTPAQLQILEELRSFAQVQRENSQQRWQPNFRSALDILDDLSKRLELESTASDKVLTSKMAAEREAQSLLNIHEAVQHYRNERSCCVCRETLSNDGLWCLAPETRNGELIVEPDAHFTCTACLEGIVEHECDATDPDGLTMGRLHENYKQMQRVVRCPGWFQGRRCLKCFDDRLVDGKIVQYPEAYRILTHARKHVLEHQLVQHYNALMEQKEEDIRKEIKRDNLSHEVSRHRMHIVENILNLRCPRCKCVFLDFEGKVLAACCQLYAH